MCSKTCHLVNAALITQVKTTALGALDPSLVAWCVISETHGMHLLGPKQNDVTVDGAHLGIGGNLNMTRRSGISL